MPFCFDWQFSRMQLIEMFRLANRKESAMNSRFFIIAIATAFSVPVAAHAQTEGSSLTRAQVREELVQLERAGYRRESRQQPALPR
jgi:hypothetical protein